MYNNNIEFSQLKGKIITGISGAFYNSYEIIFKCSDNAEYKMYHEQDCCENVTVDEIIGDIEHLLNSEILQAEEVSQDDPNAMESGTWTFYKLATIKGYITIKWYGSSNGYYSESVSFCKISA